MKRRAFTLAAAALPLLATTGTARADTYPVRPVRLIIPYPAGGGTDAVSRAVFERVGSYLGQSFVVENRGGAGSTVGLAVLARARPDGYTVGVGGTSDPLLPLLYDKLTFDPVTDLTFVATLATVPIVLVAGPGIPVRTMAELVAYAKARKGEPLGYASAGVSTPHHLAGIHLGALAGIALEHIPYKGTAPALTDLVGGHVPLAMLGLPAALAHARDGKLKILGVATARRSALAPEIPTIAEGGVQGFEAGYWWHVTVPTGTPQPIITQLREAIDKALRTPTLAEWMLKGGFEPMLLAPAEAERALKADTAKWTRVIRANNIRGS